MKSLQSLGSPAFGALRASAGLYALVDGAQVHRLGARLSIGKHVLSHRPLFGSPLGDELSDATPHLLGLSQPESVGKLLQMWGGAVQSPGAVSALVSDLDVDTLAARLIARLDVRLPDRFDAVNRFYDGRITPHLHATLHREQREVFFSVAEQWWVIAPTFQWLSLPCRISAKDRFVPPLELDDAQQATMIDACYPYAVIEHFAKTDEELLDTVPAAERYDHFRRALKVAAQFGIDGGATAILFCTLTLTRGPDFYLQPAWQADLERIKRGEISLQQAVKRHHD